MQFEGKCKVLSDEVVEKSELLDEIKEFLKTQDGFSQKSSRIADHQELEENEKLSVEIMNINRKLEDLVEQNCFLSRAKGEMEKDMGVLIRDNKQFCQVIEDLQS